MGTQEVVMDITQWSMEWECAVRSTSWQEVLDAGPGPTEARDHSWCDEVLGGGPGAAGRTHGSVNSPTHFKSRRLGNGGKRTAWLPRVLTDAWGRRRAPVRPGWEGHDVRGVWV